MTTLKIFKHSTLLILFLHIFQNECIAQRKFELGIRLDALNVPVNINTYTESGLGYYDIRAKGKITQTASTDVTWWPMHHWGLSLGIGIRKFSSKIQYSIPCPYHEDNGEIAFEDVFPFSATGTGSILSVSYRMNRIRASLGYAGFTLSNQKYKYRSGASSTTIFDGTGVLAEVELQEESRAAYGTSEINLLQLNLAYNIIDHLFLKFGVESTIGGFKSYPYTLKITGFTENTTREEHVLNDFKMRNTFAAFSAGVSYVFGYGRFYID